MPASQPRPEDSEQLLRRAYEAFNARDVEGALALMHSDVDWPNAIEGGRLHGHDAVRAYWADQFAAIDPRVEPLRFTSRGGGRIAVHVHQVVRALDGSPISDGRVVHLYTFRDGLVECMDIEEAEAAN
jgi:ketosteroid isomerase-like protein